nr:hypothetical protein Iba_chr10bCG8190 [Ipomoea batatas]
MVSVAGMDNWSGGLSPCGCGGCGTLDCGMEGFSSSGGAFSNCNTLSICPYPKLPDCSSSFSHFKSSLNVQVMKVGKLLGTIRSAAFTSNIFLVNAFGVMYAVVFSKISLHSFKISSNALAILFLISMCPIGSLRVAATSSVVIWTICPFCSYNVQLIGSKFSLRHSPILRGPLYEGLSHHLPWMSHPHPLFVSGYQLLLLGHVVLLQPALVGVVVLFQWVLVLFVLGLSVQSLFRAFCLLMFVIVLLPFSCYLHA